MSQTFIKNSKTFIFGRPSASILLLLAALALLAHTTRSVVTEDDCFCGARASQVTANNIDLYGAESSAHIISYIDQSISKFNGLAIHSTRVGDSYKIKPTSKDHYNMQNKINHQLISQLKIKVNTNESNDDNKELRATYLKSVKFSKSNNKFKTMLMEFMIGYKAVFLIEVVFVEGAKKQFNITVEQKPYLPGRNWESLSAAEIKQMKFKPIVVNRSLSHFDANQLEVDVCRMMYTFLSKVTSNSFGVSLKDHMVQFGNRGASKQIGQSCKQNVFFRKRFEQSYLTQIVNHNYSAIDKGGNVFSTRVTLQKARHSEYFKVVQDKDSGNQGLVTVVQKKDLIGFNDKNKDEIDEDQSSEEDTSTLKENSSTKSNSNQKQTISLILKPKDQDLDTNKSPVNNKHRIPMTYNDGEEVTINLRNRIIQKLQDNKHIANTLLDSKQQINQRKVTNEEITSQHSQHNLVDLIKQSEVTSHLTEDTSNRSFDRQVGHSHTMSNQSPDSNQVKKTKKKRVFVLIETIECAKCMNDLNSNAFLAIMRSQSIMI